MKVPGINKLSDDTL